MIRKGLLAALIVVFSWGAIPASAQFMAAELIYLPAVTHTNGEGESRWRSDLYITNAETDVAIDVAMVYLQTGLVSNAGVFADRSTWLGGRDDDGFGFIDPQLADIPPGGTVVLRDPVGDYWATLDNVANSGALVIFAYEANTLEDDGTRVAKNAIVNSRVFTPFTFFVPDPDNEGEFLQRIGTYGQTLPGVPWYNLADPSAVGEGRDFSFQLLTGAGEDKDFRYNVGIVNASDALTSLTVKLQPFQGDGKPFLDADDQEISSTISMAPASHVQYNGIFSTLFKIDEVPDDSVIRVSVEQWASGSDKPVVGMTIYGTMIDNKTQDPTAVLPAFGFPYDIDCQWPPTGSKGTAGVSYPRVRRLPVDIPRR